MLECTDCWSRDGSAAIWGRNLGVAIMYVSLCKSVAGVTSSTCSTPVKGASEADHLLCMFIEQITNGTRSSMEQFLCAGSQQRCSQHRKAEQHVQGNAPPVQQQAPGGRCGCCCCWQIGGLAYAWTCCDAPPISTLRPRLIQVLRQCAAECFGIEVN